MNKRRKALKRLIRKAEYAALGITMVTFIYAVMLVNAATSKPRKEFI